MQRVVSHHDTYTAYARRHGLVCYLVATVRDALFQGLSVLGRGVRLGVSGKLTGDFWSFFSFVLSLPLLSTMTACVWNPAPLYIVFMVN
jgi:hypothetical protein